MQIRKSNKRVRVEVHGPKVTGAVSPRAVERYILATGWLAVWPHDEPAEAALWYDARPRSWWENRWPQDMPVGYDRGGSPLSLPSPFYRSVPLGELIDMLGQVEGRAPSDVLRDITGR